MSDRMMSEQITSSPSLASCSPMADASFPRLFLVADNIGRFDANPVFLKSRLYPLRDDITAAMIAGWLDEWESVGCIVRWKHGGRVYGEMPNFGVYQNLRYTPKKSKYPKPENLEPLQKFPEVSEILHEEKRRDDEVDDDDEAEEKPLSTAVPVRSYQKGSESPFVLAFEKAFPRRPLSDHKTQRKWRDIWLEIVEDESLVFEVIESLREDGENKHPAFVTERLRQAVSITPERWRNQREAKKLGIPVAELEKRQRAAVAAERRAAEDHAAAQAKSAELAAKEAENRRSDEAWNQLEAAERERLLREAEQRLRAGGADLLWRGKPIPQPMLVASAKEALLVGARASP